MRLRNQSARPQKSSRIFEYSLGPPVEQVPPPVDALWHPWATWLSDLWKMSNDKWDSDRIQILNADHPPPDVEWRHLPVASEPSSSPWPALRAYRGHIPSWCGELIRIRPPLVSSADRTRCRSRRTDLWLCERSTKINNI